jgi:hypothetical protein
MAGENGRVESRPTLKGNPVSIHCFGDADRASDRLNRRSQTGVLIFINRAPILWYSKRPNTLDTSTFSSEFIAMKTQSTLEKKHSAVAYHRCKLSPGILAWTASWTSRARQDRAGSECGVIRYPTMDRQLVGPPTHGRARIYRTNLRRQWRRRRGRTC